MTTISTTQGFPGRAENPECAAWSPAEDAVQEAWLRLARQDADSIDNLAG
ncbi:hypothetical protein [Kribbella sp. NPDC049227]